MWLIWLLPIFSSIWYGTRICVCEYVTQRQDRLTIIPLMELFYASWVSILSNVMISATIQYLTGKPIFVRHEIEMLHKAIHAVEDLSFYPCLRVLHWSCMVLWNPCKTCGVSLMISGIKWGSVKRYVPLLWTLAEPCFKGMLSGSVIRCRSVGLEKVSGHEMNGTINFKHRMNSIPC